jgi:Sulfatase-modifying factor enzyme 1
VAIRGAIKCVWASLAILGVWSEIGRAGDLVQLTGWAGEGAVVRGSGVSDDVFQLVAEAEWDRSAPREPGRYQVRVAYTDGRVDTRSFPVENPPGRRRFPVYVAASPIRNQLPSSVKVAVTVIDAASGTPVSNTLSAGIAQFPRPKGDASANDPGPFGWGRPLDGVERILPSAGPDGLRFARIPASGNSPGFYLATTESTVGKVGERLKGYDPKAGRSDEFSLESPDQPAINLTPAKASDYLKALSMADPSGVAFRLPTVEEWLRAAKGGKSTAFWWGDEPTFPEGANLLGPEPALAGDATAPSQPPSTSPTFKANPYGLAHTFGNVAEWATDPAGGFARMGGHFRTEPASPLPEVKVEKADELGPDPFVGVRLAFDLTPESGAELIRKRLATDPKLSGVAVVFDPDKASVRLTGSVADSSTIRAADQALEGVWFVASVENNLKTASVGANQLAILGAPTGPSRRLGVLDRTFIEIPLSVHWLDPLPVQGSEWWVNVYLPGGGHFAHKLDSGEPGRASKTLVLIDRSKLAALGLGDNSTVQVALSLGSPAATPSENRVVSNVAAVRPTLPATIR